jgi:hypothetical protein
MFQWDKSVKTLEVPVDKVLHLFRSMREVQLALPGLPAQEASAYLCQYHSGPGVGTATVFHLHKSGQLAFYVNSPREVPEGKADSMLDQALTFVESMGFLMTDLDIHLLGAADRELLWSSLPLRTGVKPQDQVPVEKPAATVATKSPPVSSVPAGNDTRASQPAPTVKPSPVAAADGVGDDHASGVAHVAKSSPVVQDEQGDVDDLLAAVEALRARRPGVRARKKPPGPEELKRRRQELCENIGRIWASL